MQAVTRAAPSASSVSAGWEDGIARLVQSYIRFGCPTPRIGAIRPQAAARRVLCARAGKRSVDNSNRAEIAAHERNALPPSSDPHRSDAVSCGSPGHCCADAAAVGRDDVEVIGHTHIFLAQTIAWSADRAGQ
jgi:hypothetical protein